MLDKHEGYKFARDGLINPCKVTIMKKGFMEEQIRRYTGSHKTSAQIKIPVVIKTMPDV